MYFSYSKRIILKFSLILLLLLLGFGLIYFNLHEKTDLSLGYTENSKLDYKVYLSENNYYDEDYLEKGKEYLSSLIDYIDADFHYDFKLNENFSNDYTYYVETEVVVYGKNKSTTLYSKKETLLKEKVTNHNLDDSFFIIENIKIDYQKYNDLAKGFKSEYNLSNDSELIIRFVVDIDGKYDETYDIINTSDIELTLPLTEQTVTINADYKAWNEIDVITVKQEKTTREYVLVGLGIALSCIGIILLINVLLFIKRSSTKPQTAYDKTIKKILSDYDRIITNLKDPIQITDEMNVRDVTSFSELLDISDRLEEGILFTEIHKGQKSVFVVQNGNQIYRVIIKASDFEINEEKKYTNTNKLEEKDYEEIFKNNEIKEKK